MDEMDGWMDWWKKTHIPGIVWIWALLSGNCWHLEHCCCSPGFQCNSVPHPGHSPPWFTLVLQRARSGCIRPFLVQGSSIAKCHTRCKPCLMLCIPCVQLKERLENTFCSLWCFLSVEQAKAKQLWDEDNIPPQSEWLHAPQSPHSPSSPFCVCGCACVLWTAAKWLVECQLCTSVCPTMRFNGSWINATYCVCVCVCAGRCVLQLTDVFSFSFFSVSFCLCWQPWSTLSSLGLAQSYYLIHWHFV